MTKKVRTEKQQNSKKKNRQGAVAVDSELQARIGAQLRAMHDGIIQEGDPDRFRELLARLDGTKPKG